MNIEFSLSNHVYRRLYISDFYNNDTVKFLRNEEFASDKSYPPVEVAVTLDTTQLQQPPLLGYHRGRVSAIPSDQDDRYIIEWIRIVIHEIDNPDHDVIVDTESTLLTASPPMIVEDSVDLMHAFIELILDWVADIINFDFLDLNFISCHPIESPIWFMTMAIIKGIIANPKLEQQVENMILFLNPNANKTKACVIICEAIHETTHAYHLYKHFSTNTRNELIQYFQEQQKYDIVTQLLNTSNPMDPSDISKDDKWQL